MNFEIRIFLFPAQLQILTAFARRGRDAEVATQRRLGPSPSLPRRRETNESVSSYQAHGPDTRAAL